MTRIAGTRQREAILAVLHEARDGLDANALSDLVALHPNTVRWHLGVLRDGGLVEPHPEHRGARGRPRIVYRLTADGLVHDRDEYRLLAGMLTAAVAADPDGEARSYETGVHWGHQLVDAPSGESAVAAIVGILDQQGFAAEAGVNEIRMRRCPFSALAETNPGVICALHHGLIDGALEQAGAGVEVERLDPFVEPTICIARLAPRHAA
jgi:predicted ArsR family transcriptional regulator